MNDGQNTSRVLDFHESLKNEIKQHIATIHAGLDALPFLPEHLTVLERLRMSATSIVDSLTVFDHATAPNDTMTDWHELIDMNALLTQVIVMIQPLAAARAITISFTPRANYKLLLHRVAISRAFTTLLDDVIRSFGPGSTIEIDSSCATDETQCYAVLAIRMRQGDILPTFGLDRASMLMSGLANTLLQEAISLHGGSLDTKISDGNDSSSLYEIRIPGAQIAKSGAEHLGKIQILIVEDDEDVLQIIADIVRERGYEVILADNGSTALELFYKHRPTMILADVRMPGMDGISLTNAVKSADPGVPVVLFSGQYPSLHEDFQSKRLKADHVISKPFGPNDILHSLTLLLPGQT